MSGKALHIRNRLIGLEGLAFRTDKKNFFIVRSFKKENLSKEKVCFWKEIYIKRLNQFKDVIKRGILTV